MDTLERIEGCENIVGRDLEGTVCKEGKSPCDTQNATQSEDGYNIFATSAGVANVVCSGSLKTKEPGQYDDEGRKSEEEDHRIVGYVDNVVDVPVCYPAPWNKPTCQ